MIDSLKNRASRAGLAFAVTAAILTGCAAPRPAPVRESTTPPATEALPSSGGAAGPAIRQEGTHVVRPGDTLLGIARQYGVSVKDLTAWNSITDRNQIQVGQVLRVVPPGANSNAGAATQPVPAVTQPVPAVTQPVEVVPGRNGGEMPGGLKQEPRGGKQPYSEEVWASLRPKANVVPTPPPVAPPAPEPDKAAGETSWMWPANGQLIGTFDEATNKGVDIAGKPGDPVLASAGGKVVYSGAGLRGYGKLVIIKHDANYLTAYAHNQQLLVKEGDSVTKGQKIAELGSTDADRPKVHFEIRKQGRPVDPLKYLPPR